jgi:uncharacterized protein (DUF1697 family)
VAFLRAINVGGSGLLKMEDLRKLAGQLGFRQAVTVGASGNLLYDSGATTKADEEKLSRALVKRMGKGVVVVRDGAEMGALTKTDRFAKADERIPDKWRFVALLAEPSGKPLPPLPSDGPIKMLGRTSREVFYTMSEPASVAINMARLLERALGTPVTVRNWNVVRDIAKRMSD